MLGQWFELFVLNSFLLILLVVLHLKQRLQSKMSALNNHEVFSFASFSFFSKFTSVATLSEGGAPTNDSQE